MNIENKFNWKQLIIKRFHNHLRSSVVGILIAYNLKKSWKKLALDFQEVLPRQDS
jgi:hypothetical protein